MLNGQLKPAYNIQHGVDSEYITWIDISPHPKKQHRDCKETNRRETSLS